MHRLLHLSASSSTVDSQQSLAAAHAQLQQDVGAYAAILGCRQPEVSSSEPCQLRLLTAQSISWLVLLH